MSEQPRICAYYSHGPHFARMLQGLREAHPNAHVTAMLPPDYPVSDDVERWADAVVRTEFAQYSPRDLAACRRLLGQIRAARYDVFAVMFDSDLLCLLAALSGARGCLHATPDGRLVPLSASFIVAFLRTVAHQGLGRLVYAVVYLAVGLLPTRTKQ